MANRPRSQTAHPAPDAGPVDSLADSQPPAFTFSFLMRVLRRRWVLCFFGGLVLASLGTAAVWLRFEPSYEASAWFSLDAHPEFVAFEKSGEDPKFFLQTQVEMLRSPAILEPVASHPLLVEHEVTEEDLKEELQVYRQKESQLLVLRFVHTEPEVAALVVNQVAEVYSRQQADNESTRNKQRTGLLEEERQQRLQATERIRTELNAVLKQHPHLVPLIENKEDAREGLTVLQDRLVTVQVDLEVMRSDYDVKRRALEQREFEIPPGMIETALDKKPPIQELGEIIGRKEAEWAEATSAAAKGTENKQMKKQLDLYYEQFREARDRLRPLVVQELEDEAEEELKDELALLDLEVKKLEGLEQRFREQLAVQFSTADDTPGFVEASYLNRELAQAEAVYQRLGERLETLATEQNVPGRARIVWSARTPDEPLSSMPLLEMAAAIVAGFSLPAFLAILLERGSDRVSERQAFQRNFPTPLVAETAYRPPRWKVSSQNAPRKGKQLVFEESIDALWTRLQLVDELGHRQVIVITSAVSGEGKTCLAASLASKVARWYEEPILVVDGDLRSPQMHELFELGDQPGLADVLAGRTNVQDAIASVPMSSLDVLPAGHVREAPHGLYHGDQLGRMFRDLRQSYRFIIVDVPPVLSASESLLVAKAADGVLMCVMWEKSRAEQVHSAYERLDSIGVDVMGLVLNGIPTRSYVRANGRYQYHLRNGHSQRENGHLLSNSDAQPGETNRLTERTN